MKKAAKAAKSWADDDQAKKVAQFQQDRMAILTAKGGEEWAINKAIHYNEWANLSRNDFSPVVTAFRELLQQFRCSNCDTWIHVTPRNEPEDLRCSCGALHLNLKGK